jgi:small-conductance mechanosensitive channel
VFGLQLVPDLTSLAAAVALRAGYFALAFAAVYAAGRLVVEPLLSGILRARRVEPTVERPLRRLVRVAVLFFALTFGLSAAGLGNLLSASATIAAAFTLAVGLATQNLMANVVSGAFIVADEKFELGDWIRWGDKEGVVEDIGFRVTRVRTFDDELVTVPNSNLTDGEVVNPVAGDRLRVTHSFKLSRDSDVDEAIDLLLEAARTDPAVLDDPEPSVGATDLGANHIGLEARFWLADPDREEFVDARSAFVRRVDRRFAAEGVELAA